MNFSMENYMKTSIYLLFQQVIFRLLLFTPTNHLCISGAINPNLQLVASSNKVEDYEARMHPRRR